MVNFRKLIYDLARHATPLVSLYWLDGNIARYLLLAHRNFWVMDAFATLIAGLRAQLGFEAVTVVGEVGTSPKAAPVIGDLAQDRKRSMADNAVQVTLIGTFVFVSFAMPHFGTWGFNVLPIAYTALLVFYDTRPDLGRKIFPQMWQREKAVVRKVPRRKRSKW